MIGEQSEPGAVQDHGAHYRFLGCLQFPYNLTQAHHGILFLQNVLEVDFNGFHQVDQRVRGAPRFVEHIVDLGEWCFQAHLLR